MVVASYKSKEATYSLVKAEMKHIVADMGFALQDNVSVNESEYIERMEESVRQGLAFRITKDGKKIGVMYNLFRDGEYQGAALWCRYDRVGMLILMKSMFDVYDWHKIKVSPHKGGLKYFVSMATSASIKACHENGQPLVIVRKSVTAKGPELFKYLGIKVL